MEDLASSSLKDRLLYYLKEKKISQSDFCNSIGVNRAYVASIVKCIGDDKKKIIKEKYPDLDMNWLVYGEGEMLITQDSTPQYRMSPDEIIKLEEKDKEIAALKAQIQILKEMILEMKSERVTP